MLRVAIGGFAHETNTFHPTPTTLEAFHSPPGTWLQGEAILERYSGSQSVFGGMLDACAGQPWTVVPTFYAEHPPTKGTVTAEAFQAIRANLVQAIRDARPDGVLLFLHGACVATGVADPEAVVLRDVREAVGPDRPIVVVYDLHANIGLEWLDYATVIIGFKTAPHTDFYDRGLEAGNVLARILAGDISPVMAGARPPIMIKAGLMSMTSAPLALIKPPMFWLATRAREMERHPRIINVSVAAGFGDADSAVTGMTMLVTANGDRELAQTSADELAALAWKLRRGILTDPVLTPVDQAVDRALHADGTVILADQGNNTAGGSPGDGTAILAALKAAGWPDAALFIADPAAMDACWEAGVGRTVDLQVGGKLEPTNGQPVSVQGVVHLLTDGVARGVTGTPAHFGKTAVLRCGKTELVLTEFATSQTDPHYFRVVGIEPREKHIVVVQSAHLFRTAFEVRERIPAMIIEVDSPGITSPNPTRFAYQHLRRPIYPLDDFEWAGPA